MADQNNHPTEDLQGLLQEMQARLTGLELQNAELRRFQEQQSGVDDYRFRSVIEQAREGIALIDEKGSVIVWNQAMVRITGLANEATLAKSIWDVQFQLLPAEQRIPKAYDSLKSSLLSILETGQAPWLDTSMEREYVHPNGSRTFVEGYVHPIKTEQGFMLVSISQDISDRKRVQAALESSEEQFRTSVESLLDGLAIFSTIRDEKNKIVDFRYEYINDVGCQLNHRSREEQIGHTLLELLPAHKNSGVFNQYVNVVETGEPLVSDNILYEDVFDGFQPLARIFDFQAFKLGDGFVVTWRDVTERVKDRQALLQAEKIARSTLDGLSAHIAIIDQDGTILAVNQAWREFASANGGVDSKTNEGVNYLSVSESATGESSTEGKSFANGIHAVLNGHLDKFEMEYPCHSKDRERWFIGRVTRFPPGGPARAVIAHEDVSERKFGEQALRRAQSQLTTLLEISQTVVSTLDLQPLLNLVLKKLATVVHYSGAAIATLEGEFLQLEAYRGPMLPGELSDIRVLISEFREMRRLILSGQPFFIRDIKDHPQMLSEINMTLGQLGWPLLSRFRSWLVVPLVVQNHQIGIMVLTNRKINYYKPFARDMVRMFANHVAIAIQNAQLYQKAQVSAVLEERNRLARELHDSVTQALYSINLYANATRRALETNKLDTVDSHLNELQRTSNEAVADMRMLIFDLRPPILDADGLVEAIRTRLESVETRAGIQVSFDVEGEPHLTKTIETELYRVVREVLNNVIKHAHATQIKMTIKSERRRVYLTIQDNGIGFDPSLFNKGWGQGFRIIQERIRQINGIIRLETAPEKGTTIFIEVGGD